MNNITFAHPDLFYVLLAIIPIVGWYIFKVRGSNPTFKASVIDSEIKLPNSYKRFGNDIIFALKIISFALIVTAIARPQSSLSWQDEKTEGIDIVVSLDISTSMLAEDFKPNRIEAAKDMAIEFVNSRRHDRMGLVVFAGESFTQCPITTDRATLLNLFQDVECGLLEDGTAIGSGLATSVSRLKDSKAKSKVVILLTDGENNTGEIAPITAAEIASTFGIKVYTIGVGTIGKAPYPVNTPFGTQYRDIDVKIDEPTLREISKITGGEYFRAVDNKSLENIYAQIDKLERTEIDVEKFSRKEEVYHRYLLAAIVLLIAATFLKQTLFRTLD